MDHLASKNLIDRLSRSRIFHDYERAFSEATGLPLNLAAVEQWRLAHRGNRHENPFCAMMSRCGKTCSACLETQKKSSEATAGPQTITCFAGMCETSVPLRVGDAIIGFLQTGEVMTSKPTSKQFTRVAKELVSRGFEGDLKEVEEAFLQTRVLSKKQYESVVRLLAIFSEHLSTLSNQIVVQSTHAEPPAITKARRYIEEHQADEISLASVAKAVNMSSYYFCKMFKKVTGMNFVEYLARVRVEKAKQLLLNRNERVSEVAFEAGFQSITNFNRTFKKVVGQSPTEYREALPKAA